MWVLICFVIVGDGATSPSRLQSFLSGFCPFTDLRRESMSEEKNSWKDRLAFTPRDAYPLMLISG